MNDLDRMIECYRAQYGSDTEALFAALKNLPAKIALINPFLSPADKNALIQEGQTLPYCSQALRLPKDREPSRIDGLLSHYFMDLSSLFAPLLLPLSPRMRVLDMCSAPGGKLLAMVSRKVNDVFFTANDISQARTMRLKRVAADYLPKKFIDGSLQITTRDATFFGLRAKESFDAVLLDAPCSSEAHIVQNPNLLKKFSGLRRSLPQRQYSLLSAALLATKPGGHIMYATCSINYLENQGVIEKVMRKKKSMCELVEISPPLGQRGDCGVTILPHLHGAGPAFYSLVKRI